ncbi:MAG: radical SAM protein [archaeon]
MYHKVTRLGKWKNGTPAGPVALDLNPTYRCNLECKFCEGSLRGTTREGKDQLTTGRCLQIIDDAADMGVRQVHLSGDGEPLCRKEAILPLMQHIKKRGLRGQLTTNGTLLSGMVPGLVGIRWDAVFISLEGPDSRTHDYLCGVQGSYDRICSALLKLCRYPRWKRPALGINTVVNRHNCSKLAEMILLGAKYGADSVNFEPLVANPNTGRLALDDDDKDRLPEEIDAAIVAAHHQRITTNVSFLSRHASARPSSGRHDPENIETGPDRQAHGFSDYYCYQPWHKMVVRPDGSVQPCCNIYDPDADNILAKSLKDIWYGPYFSKMRLQISQNRKHSDCAKCSLWIQDENRRLRVLLSKGRFHQVAELGQSVAAFGVGRALHRIWGRA